MDVPGPKIHPEQNTISVTGLSSFIITFLAYIMHKSVNHAIKKNPTLCKLCLPNKATYSAPIRIKIHLLNRNTLKNSKYFTPRSS
ncbi:hypothetical protein QL285_012721 [Trifolium repens]|nr:hypothetical protein QL285_012721 [Trifolium repens]